MPTPCRTYFFPVNLLYLLPLVLSYLCPFAQAVSSILKPSHSFLARKSILVSGSISNFNSSLEFPLTDFSFFGYLLAYYAYIKVLSMKKMLPAISVNKGCCHHQAITLHPSLTVSPKGTQDRNRMPTM